MSNSDTSDKNKIGIVCSLHVKAGVSRVVATICQYFRDKVVIFTNCRCDKAALQEIPRDTIVNEIYPQRVLIPASLLRALVSGISQALTLWKILQKEKNIKILNPHKMPLLLVSCVVKLLLVPRKIKISWLLYNEEEIHDMSLPLKTIVRIFVMLGIIDQILVLNNQVGKLVRRELRAKEVRTVRLGVSLTMMRLHEQLSKGPLKKSGKIVALHFHGMLMPRRRLEDLLKSVAILKSEFRDKKLILYISGSTSTDRRYFNKLVRITKNLELTSDVKFLNFLSDEDLARMYKSSDIFVFPCEKQSWGIAPLEAMLFEKPVIVSSGVGVSEVLRGENVAITVSPRSPEKLAEAIGLLIRNKGLRKKMGVNASKFVKNHLTFVQTGKRLEKLWSSLLAS
jgi:glycosyltransferase involved in cell wall biosynthesis